MMTEERFWQILESSREKAKAVLRKQDDDFADVHEQNLHEVLRNLPPEEIAAFDARMTDFHVRAYRWDLWGAAYWMGGGCSDDGFMDFRYCLVSLGKDLYTRILADPDVLAETVDRKDVPYMQAEGIGYIARKVYKELTGEEMPDPDPAVPYPAEPAGENFDFDDPVEVRRRYPRLVKRLPEGG